MNTSEQIDDVWGEMSPQQRLCVAVLNNAIDALLKQTPHWRGAKAVADTQRERLRASNFLFNPDPYADVRYWCEGAGVSRAWFVEQIRARKQKLVDRKERLSRTASAAYTQRASEA